MIPPGIHFVYYSAVSKEGQTAPRTGFFHNFKSKEIVVKKWNNQTEDIEDCQVTDEDLVNMRADLRNLDRNLGPYPYDIYKDWISLSHHLRETVLEELLPLNRKISSASELIPDPATTEEKEAGEGTSSGNRRHRLSTEDLWDAMLPKMRLRPGTEIRFTKFPELNHPEGSSAAEISKHNMDLSYTLFQMANRYDSPDDFLGEFQMAFICFVVGQVYEAFEHWRLLLRLLCSCDDALVATPRLFLHFITDLHFQLQHIPKDFFVDIVSGTNYLTTTLQVFFANLEENGQAPKELLEKGRRFRVFLTRKFRWDFNVEPEEDAPVVVET